jgi:hypothetical protein
MYAAVLLLTHEEYYYQSYYAFTPYIIKAANWSPLETSPRTTPAVNDLLSQDLQWMAYGEEFSSQTNPNGCLNLTAKASPSSARCTNWGASTRDSARR